MDKATDTLLVVVKQANGLRNVQKGFLKGKQDPYVRLQIPPDSKWVRTKVDMDGGDKPKWSEADENTHTFQILPGDKVRRLKCEIYNWSKKGNDVLICSGEVPVPHLQSLSGTTEVPVALMFSGSPAGTLMLDCTYTTAPKLVEDDAAAEDDSESTHSTVLLRAAHTKAAAVDDDVETDESQLHSAALEVTKAMASLNAPIFAAPGLHFHPLPHLCSTLFLL